MRLSPQNTLSAARERLRLLPLAGFTAALAGVILMAASVRINAPAGKASFAITAPELVVTRVDRMSRANETRDRLELLDPTPLFMPVSESVALNAPAPMGARPGGRVGELFESTLVFPDSGAGRAVLAPSGPKSAQEAAETLGRGRWFEGLARRDDATPTAAPRPRVARLEIYREGESSPAAALDIDTLAGTVPASWRPLELSLVVDAAGMVARPAIVTGSG
ncbi:MAG: hypothetical protein RIQ79_2356, partial [Verrucomicrobiota bacterium]